MGLNVKTLFTLLLLFSTRVLGTNTSEELLIPVPKPKAVIISSVPAGLPLPDSIVNQPLSWYSGFGYRIHPVYKKRKLHTGIDFPAPKGTPILATSYGTVSKVGLTRGYGLYVKQESGPFSTLYAHCSRVLVEKGETVAVGDTIALVGETGTATGTHLHFEVHYKGLRLDPIKYLTMQQ